MGHRRESEATERQALHLAIGGMEHDLVDAPAARVEGAEGRRVPVGVGRERVQLAARHGPHGVELGPRALEHVGRHDRFADEGEIRIGAEEIHAARRRHAVLGRGRHAPPFHHIGRVGARCWPVGPRSVL
jgi:hypothetical protein